MESNREIRDDVPGRPSQKEEELGVFGPAVNDADLRLILSGARDYITPYPKRGQCCSKGSAQPEAAEEPEMDWQPLTRAT